MTDPIQKPAWNDRLVDALRSRATLLFLIGLLLGWLIFADHGEPETLMVTVHNDSPVLIEAIWFDFSHGHRQSSLYEGQIRPGESRLVALNHPPGAGFNMKVRYADGMVQEFCANRGVREWVQEVRIYR
ncbi:hypothetical protein [Thioalkalivibrio sulfidiphilus]|uniref:hypothetical protein n=1 Tax=Thioalkalivibrio sulfidiphilus TaxID=1033854 RepID=UPI000366A02E|nr:hypothetical protein [Thioalkalivibrio sulfidiphilus]